MGPWAILIYFLLLGVAVHFWKEWTEPKVKSGRFRRPR
jgi:hypothetical protein